MTGPKISVLVPAFNNEDIIERCLRSCRWASEVVLCDSFSTDRTLDCAAPLVDRVLRHEYRNSAAQKNWAIPQLRHDWVLIVDTDELVTSELRSEIESVLSRPVPFTGFRLSRANYVFGRWLRNGDYWPDYQIRLFRRDSGRYEDREVHAHVELDGACGTLCAPIVHFPHRSLASIRHTLLRRYAAWEAIEKQKRGIRFHPLQLVTRPAGCFIQRYVVRKGYRDGWQGLLMAVVWTCYVFLTYVNLRRLESQDAR